MAKYEITGPDGHIYEVEAPDSATEEEILAYVQSQVAAEVPKAPIEEPEEEGSFFNALGKGLSLGWSDELAGALGATYGKLSGDLPDSVSWLDAYRGIQQEADADTKAFEQRNPMGSLALEMTGGLLTGGLGAARVAGTKAVTGMPKYMRYAGAGAGTGAVAGAGDAKPGEMLEGTAKGAAVGGALGVGVPVLAGTAKGAIKTVSDAVKKPQGVADAKIAEAIMRDGYSPERLSARLKTMGPEATIMDAAGPNTVGLARASTSFPGPAKAHAERVLNKRQYGQGDRITDQLKQVFSPTSDFYGTVDDISASMRTKSAPAYQAAHAVDVPFTDTLKRVIQTRHGANAWKKAQDIAEAEGHALPQVFKFSDDGARVVDMIDVPDMKTLDYVKQGLDDVVEDFVEPFTGRIKGNAGNAVRKLRNEFRDELDRLNPLYKDARDVYAGHMTLRNALDKGRTLLRDDADLTERAISKMSESEKEMFRIGVSKAIRDQVENAGDGHDVYKRLFNSKGKRRKLKLAFPDDKSFRQFEKTMMAESRMFENRSKVLGGSPTARIEAEKVDSLVDPLAIAGDAMTGNTQFAMMNATRNLLSRVQLPTDKLRNTVADDLMTTDPTKQQDLIQRLLLGNVNKSNKAQKVGLGLTGGAGANIGLLMP